MPTGNFGDILAGYFARLMGLPVGRLVCASNANRILTDFLTTGVYDKRREFLKTTSPSMDILVSSNLERLLFLATGGDAEKVAAWMRALSEDGAYRVEGEPLERIQSVFSAGCCDERQSEETIGRVWRDFGYLSDPHTAVALHVAEEYKQTRESRTPLVVLSTASPYKFPAAVLRAVGGELSGDEFQQMERLAALSGVPVPKGLQGLKERPVLHEDVIDREEILSYVLGQIERV